MAKGRAGAVSKRSGLVEAAWIGGGSVRVRPNGHRKTRFQRRIVREFLLEYNREAGTKFEVQRDGEPPEPVEICDDTRTGDQIGIEVTIESYEDAPARSVRQRTRGKRALEDWLTRSDSQENLRVLRWVNQAIRRKSKRRYRFPGRLLLLVVPYSIRLHLTRMKEQLRVLRVPAKHPFHEIYVYSTQGEPYQLFPSRKWIGTYTAHNE